MSNKDETLVEQRRLQEQEAKAAFDVTSYFQDIQEFHAKFTDVAELNAEEGPRDLPDDLALFRIGFMVEELAEYAGAAGYTRIMEHLNSVHQHIKDKSRWIIERSETRNLHDQLDSLVDLTYVAVGTAYHHNTDFDEAWKRVHAANMKKVLAKSADESKRGYRFDVVKPKGWQAPDLSDLVE